jgi:hypothetical protein
VAETAQGLKGRVLKRKFVLYIESGFSPFFSLSFFAHGLHDVVFNMTTTI